jgi:hypothetical protein
VRGANGPPAGAAILPHAGERGRDGGAADATAEVLAQAGLSDEELRAVAEDARRDGVFGFKWPPD